MRLGRWVLAVMVLLATCNVGAFGGGPGAVRKQIEAGMLVTGFVEVDAEGRITRFGMDERDKLPEGVVTLLNRSIPLWRFEPTLVDGVPAAARTDMSLRIVARHLEGGKVEVRINGATFGAKAVPAQERVEGVKLAPPNYPEAAARARAGGTVYLMVKVGRDGKVQDTAVEQVNLRFITDEKGMQQLRRMLSAAAQRAAKGWTFQPPSRGESAQDPFWTVRVPVAFAMQGARAVTPYGQWESYIPGPRQRAPWEQVNEGLAFTPDALPDGGVYQAGQGLRLVTPPGG